jgi:hypothetical protein
MGLTGLSRATQLPKPTVQRLLSALEKYGFAEKNQGRYRLGVAVLPLGHAFLLFKELTRVTLPMLQELAQASGETTALFLRSGFHSLRAMPDGPVVSRAILPEERGKRRREVICIGNSKLRHYVSWYFRPI